MFPRIYKSATRLLPSSIALYSSTASSSRPSAHQLHQMSVKQLVSEAIDQNKIAIFSKSYCPYCRRAKALFAESFPDVETVVFELDERDDGSDIQAYLAELTGQRTVPNVFINKTHVGGSDAVAALHKQGGIAKLLQSEA